MCGRRCLCAIVLVLFLVGARPSEGRPGRQWLYLPGPAQERRDPGHRPVRSPVQLVGCRRYRQPACRREPDWIKPGRRECQRGRWPVHRGDERSRRVWRKRFQRRGPMAADLRPPAGRQRAVHHTLSPRQKITGTPYALFATAPWKLSGTNLCYTGGNVGIGTSAPSVGLEGPWRPHGGHPVRRPWALSTDPRETDGGGRWPHQGRPSSLMSARPAAVRPHEWS